MTVSPLAAAGPLLRMVVCSLFTINRADELALRKYLRMERNMSEHEILELGSAYFWKRCRKHSRPKEEQGRLFLRTVRVSVIGLRAAQYLDLYPICSTNFQRDIFTTSICSYLSRKTAASCFFQSSERPRKLVVVQRPRFSWLPDLMIHLQIPAIA
jgi:hypothetical protein